MAPLGLGVAPPLYGMVRAGVSKVRMRRTLKEPSSLEGFKNLRCRNCGTLGHNIKMCHRHLPPKTPAHEIGTKQRKLNSGDASSIKGTKPLPKTKNELRAKAQLRKVAAKDKRDAKRVSAKTTGRGPPTKGRPPKAATSTVINASANTQPSQASSRSSVRIRANANKGGK